jgi:protoheme IX farnesyltransferase
MIRWVKILGELTKFRISLFVTLSACAGFILAREGLSRAIILPGLGIFFLSCGSCALNQYQEKEIDGKMERTKGRPLPAGKMSPSLALLVSGAFMLSGFLLLLFGGKGLACGLGLFATLWYNGVYLHLKRKTTFAVVPGALIGAIPPAVGWVSGGGSLFDPRLGAVSLFFFLWQIPHFWLLLLGFADDYERSGLPSLARLFTAQRSREIAFIWILSTAVSCLLLPLFVPVNFEFTLIALLAITFWLIWGATGFLRSPGREGNLKYILARLNIYAVIVFGLLSLDRLLNSGDLQWGPLSQIFSGLLKSV